MSPNQQCRRYKCRHKGNVDVKPVEITDVDEPAMSTLRMLPLRQCRRKNVAIVEVAITNVGEPSFYHYLQYLAVQFIIQFLAVQFIIQFLAVQFIIQYLAVQFIIQYLAVQLIAYYLSLQYIIQYLKVYYLKHSILQCIKQYIAVFIII